VVLCDSEILKLLKLIKQQAGNFEHATRMLLFMGKEKIKEVFLLKKVL
jgi:hypothetical protein